MIGVLCALPQEYEAIKSVMEKIAEKDLRNCRICAGEVAGQKMVLIQTGVGKVCAALGVNLVHDLYQTRLIISTGLAGIINPALSIGDIVIGGEVCYHDCFRDPSLNSSVIDSYLCLQKVFAADQAIISQAKRILTENRQELPARLKKNRREYPTVEVGKVISGDTPVHKAEISKSLYTTYQASCVDMEAAGAVQSCYMIKIPWLTLKIMSDHSNESSYLNVLRYMDPLCNYIASVIRNLVINLPDQSNLQQNSC